MAKFLNGRVMRRVASLLVGGTAVVLLVASYGSEGFTLLVPLVLLYFAIIVVHEGGHALAGRLIGWNVYLAGVGPLLVRFRPFAVRMGRVPGRQYFGWVLAAPPSLAKRTRTRLIWFYLGGALANVATALSTAAIFAFSPGASAKGAAAAIIAMSLAVGLSTLVPFYRKKVARSDGAKIVALFRKPQTLVEYDVALTNVVLLYMSGTRPSLWSEALVAVLEAGSADDAKDAAADTYLFERYFFTGDFARARAVLDRSLARAEKLSLDRDGFHIADAFLAALVERDAVHAEAALARVQKPEGHKFSYARAEAAIAIAHGDRAGALEALRAARIPRFAVNPFLRPLLGEIQASMTDTARALPTARPAALTPA